MKRPKVARRLAESGGSGQTSSPRLTTSAMIASLAAPGQRTKPAPFGHALAALAASRSDIVGLTADLAKYTDLHIFAKAFPDRFYQMGMAEQLLMAAAAGMAREGFTPFATTYAVFAARRAYDFICMAIAEENLDVKIVCALPGLTTGYGPSHQATEDVAIFRAMPNMGLAKAMARELGVDGVRVNTIAPGLIDTDITGGMLTEDLRAQIMSGIPLNRVGRPDEVANVCLFLASDLSSYITGAVIDVNGGMLIH